tara:strand:- start:414163 stop:414597 length:435 start_codon:yes stop_codon:yes gene_type:complete
MFSKSSKYGIRALLYVATYASFENKISAKELADKIDVPAPFLAKILQGISKRNLITAIRGKHGGFYLTEDQKLNTLIAIVDSIDGLEVLHQCTLGLADCSNTNPCPFHATTTHFRKAMIDELTCKTIQDISKEIKSGVTRIDRY